MAAMEHRQHAFYCHASVKMAEDIEHRKRGKRRGSLHNCASGVETTPVRAGVAGRKHRSGFSVSRSLEAVSWKLQPADITQKTLEVSGRFRGEKHCGKGCFRTRVNEGNLASQEVVSGGGENLDSNLKMEVAAMASADLLKLSGIGVSMAAASSDLQERQALAEFRVTGTEGLHADESTEGKASLESVKIKTLEFRQPLVLEISGELLGVFKYVERQKRARVKALAKVLSHLGIACIGLALVRGVATPLISAFATKPPNLGKLAGMATAIDYGAVAILAFRARTPMLQMANLAVESQPDAVEAMERQEEIMVLVVNELIGLFSRMRNVLIMVGVTQLAQLAYSNMHLMDPMFVVNATNMVKAIVLWPWAG